jgi:hypothetical protein
MRAVRQIVTVPASRELRIQLPEEAAPHEEAEVIVLFRRDGADDRVRAMREAMSDELFLADLVEVGEDFGSVPRALSERVGATTRGPSDVC